MDLQIFLYDIYKLKTKQKCVWNTNSNGNKKLLYCTVAYNIHQKDFGHAWMNWQFHNQTHFTFILKYFRVEQFSLEIHEIVSYLCKLRKTIFSIMSYFNHAFFCNRRTSFIAETYTCKHISIFIPNYAMVLLIIRM